MEKLENIIINTDGGARANPGPSAYGVVIKSNGKPIANLSKFLGIATNNEAEYEGVLAALTWLFEHKEEIVSPVKLFSDSTLIVNQLLGKFKIKEPRLARYVSRIKELEQELANKIIYTVIPRSQNAEADFLVNQTLDAYTSKS